MRTPIVWWCLVLCATPAFAGGGKVKKFCDAWTKASANAERYDDAIQATLEALQPGDEPFSWDSALRALGFSSPSSHPAIMREAAKEAGETFDCPAFEFPGGQPHHQIELDAESAVGTVAIAVDGSQLFVLRELHEKNKPAATVLQRGKTVIATGLSETGSYPELLLSAKSVVVISKEISVVPRAGGKPLVLMTRDRIGGFAIDGETLLFLNDGKLQSVPLAGGAPRVVVAFGGTPQLQNMFGGGSGSNDDMQSNVFVTPRGWIVSAAAGTFCVSRDGKLTELERGGRDAFVIGNELYGNWGSASAPPKSLFKKSKGPAAAKPEPGLYKFPCDGAPVRVGPDFELAWHVPSKDGAVFGLDRIGWTGKIRLMRFKPGQAKPALVAEPIGDPYSLLVADRRVYWFDRRFGPIYSVATSGQ
ncbi:MAG: hypothetical protein QM817_11230 [Archangium sp.]